MIERNIIPCIFGRSCSRVKEASRPCRSRTRPGRISSAEIRSKAQLRPRRPSTEDSRVRAPPSQGSAGAAQSSTIRSLTANDETVPNQGILQNEPCGRSSTACRSVSADVSGGVGRAVNGFDSESSRQPSNARGSTDIFCSIDNLDKRLQLAASIALCKPFRSCSVSEPRLCWNAQHIWMMNQNSTTPVRNGIREKNIVKIMELT